MWPENTASSDRARSYNTYATRRKSPYFNSCACDSVSVNQCTEAQQWE